MGLQRRRVAIPRTPPLLRQAAVYAASQLGSRAIPFLLLPVMTRYLSPADYGIVTMFLFTAVILEPVVGLGLQRGPDRQVLRQDDRPPAILRDRADAWSAQSPFPCFVLFLVRERSAGTQVPAAWLLLAVPLVVAR